MSRIQLTARRAHPDPNHRAHPPARVVTRRLKGMFSVRSRAFGAVFDDIVAFFRPTYSHVREEKQRLELTREEVGDAAPSLRLGDRQIRLTIPPNYEPPAGPRGNVVPGDSSGMDV